MTAPSFSTEERLAILGEWQRQSAAWKPKSGHAAGCLMMLAAVVILMMVPALARSFSVPALLRGAGMVLGVLLGIAGFISMQTRVLPGDPRAIVADAVTLLTTPGADAAARRAAAISLLFHYMDVRGPTQSNNYESAVVAQQLGGELDYLCAVERVLVAELKFSPVYTV